MRVVAYITASERDRLAVWKAAGTGIRDMAQRLGCNHRVIFRELARDKTNGYDVAISAQAKARKRKYLAGLRLSGRMQTCIQVLRQLRQGWFLEIIAGRLKRKHGGKLVICHKTIAG